MEGQMIGGGRGPNMSDPRQGKARGEGYRRRAGSGLKGLLLLAAFAIVVAVGFTFLAEPTLRGWGLGLLAVIIVGVTLWRWRRRATRPSISETLSDLGED